MMNESEYLKHNPKHKQTIIPPYVNYAATNLYQNECTQGTDVYTLLITKVK